MLMHWYTLWYIGENPFRSSAVDWRTEQKCVACKFHRDNHTHIRLRIMYIMIIRHHDCQIDTATPSFRVCWVHFTSPAQETQVKSCTVWSTDKTAPLWWKYVICTPQTQTHVSLPIPKHNQIHTHEHRFLYRHTHRHTHPENWLIWLTLKPPLLC